MGEQSAIPDLSALKVLTGGRDPGAAAAELGRCSAGDGLPLVAPTADRVRAMLAGQAPESPVAPLPPLMMSATAEDVAVCAVLAGCAPGWLRFIAAAMEAAAAPEFNLLGISTTTGNAAVGVILHGPGPVRLGAAGGPGCLGPSAITAAVGRAVALSGRLLGGALPGTLDMATVGQPAKLSMCLAEPVPPAGWTALHVARGCPPGSDAVTVFGASGIIEVADTSSDSGQGLLETLAAATPLPAGVSSDGTVLGGGQQLFVLPPEWVTRLVADGCTRETAAAFMYEHAVLPLDRLPTSARFRLSDDVWRAGQLRSARSAADVLFVCAGGPGVKAAYLPSWPGGSTAVTRAVG